MKFSAVGFVKTDSLWHLIKNRRLRTSKTCQKDINQQLGGMVELNKYEKSQTKIRSEE